MKLIIQMIEQNILLLLVLHCNYSKTTVENIRKLMELLYVLKLPEGGEKTILDKKMYVNLIG